MNKINKADIGLGEVRNRVAPSMVEFNLLQEKLDALNQSEVIDEKLTTFELSNKVIRDENDALIVDLTKVNKVKVTVDRDRQRMWLVGGVEGNTVTFEFLNEGSNDIHWGNLRTSGGQNPGIAHNDGYKDYTRTIFEVLRLGIDYYLINEIYEV